MDNIGKFNELGDIDSEFMRKVARSSFDLDFAVNFDENTTLVLHSRSNTSEIKCNGDFDLLTLLNNIEISMARCARERMHINLVDKNLVFSRTILEDND